MVNQFDDHLTKILTGWQGDIIAIASVTIGGGIGYRGNLLIRSRADMQWFKKVTRGHTLVSGRGTGATLKLPGRQHFCLSRQPDLSTVEGEASPDSTTLFVIGGAAIYHQALPFCDSVYLTQFYKEATHDATFPMEDLRKRFILEGETTDVGNGFTGQLWRNGLYYLNTNKITME